jgi:hypothetical protein
MPIDPNLIAKADVAFADCPLVTGPYARRPTKS